jgi:AcrR family transcriptional regulator
MAGTDAAAERAAPAGGRNANGRDRKAQIIEVATALFREKGYHATSLDDIAERIGFTKPAIYYYFRSKEDILFEIVDGVVHDALARMRAIADRDEPIVDRLHAILVENTRVVLENLDANTVFYNERGLLSPERERMVRDREREYTQLIRDLYVIGVANDELVDVDPTVATSTLLGASIWAYRWFDDRGRLSSDEVADQVAGLLMSGYRR